MKPAAIPLHALLAALHARRNLPNYRHYCAALSPCLGGPGARSVAGGILVGDDYVRSARYLVWKIRDDGGGH